MQTRASLERIAGWAAYLSAATGALSIIALIGFFALEFQQAVSENWANTYPFGNLNDLLNIVQGLAMLPATAVLYRATRRNAPALSLVTLIAGVAGLLMLAATQTLYVTHAINSNQQTALYFPSWGIIGLWLLLVNMLAHQQGVLPIRVTRLGLLIGACLVFQMLVFELFGGAAIAADPASILTNPIVMIGSSAGLFAGIAGWPLWAFWLGSALRAQPIAT